MLALVHPTPDAAYEAEQLAEWRRTAKLGCLLSLVIVPLFSLQGLVTGATHAAPFVELRLGSMALTALVLWLLTMDWGRARPRTLTLVQALNIGFMVDLITVLTGGGESPRYAGLTLLIFGGAVLMPWRPLLASVASAVLVGIYVLLTVATGRVGDPGAFRMQIVYLSCASAIGVVSCGYRERLRRREFASRMALVDALRHQSDFTAKWSHEVRTPINVMIGYADILLDEVLERDGAEARRLVQRIRGNGVQLRSLISDLLDFSKAEAGQMRLNPEALSVREVVEETADMFRPLAERKGLQIRAVCPADVPDVLTDRQRLCQILTNLVSNAIKFTDEGRISLEVHTMADLPPELRSGFTFLESRKGRPAPCAADAPAELVILVRDTGIGIREADVARLAADYQQLDAKKYGGTGLGLSISKRLAQLLGGRIGVASRHQDGTTFALFLPLAAPAYQAAA